MNSTNSRKTPSPPVLDIILSTSDFIYSGELFGHAEKPTALNNFKSLISSPMYATSEKFIFSFFIKSSTTLCLFFTP